MEHVHKTADDIESLREKYKHINGWGIDADPENEPTYPMKHYTGDDHKRIHYDRPTLQPLSVEVLKSNERPNVTAVFGTSTPPSGLSGAIRRYAFRYSEGSFGHWLPLIFADRVNVIEGYLDDFSKGIIPNIFAEHGWKAEWKHAPWHLVRKVATTVAVIGAVVWLLSGDKKKKSLV
ncbi:MAG: hypothetical protein EOO12_16935 [Chitinophagaceae bacterium]|nr:MAG: hypothetical protein EOO12_16935 [Chitinophagaceae bacterium]